MSRREVLEREASRLRDQQSRIGLNFWRPKVGKNTVRILPHWSGDVEELFYHKFKRHFGVGPSKAQVICRKSYSDSEDCPICDHVAELKATGRRDDAYAARDISAKERFMVNMIDVNDPQAGVQQWEMGAGLFNDILMLFLDPDFGDMDNLETGRHIKVDRVGEGKFDTKYTVIPAGTATRIDPRVMSKAKNLEELCAIPSLDEVVAALEGEEYYEGDNEEDVSEFLGDDGEEEAEPASPPSGSEEKEEEVLSIPLDDTTEPAAEKSEEPKPRTTSTRAERLAEMRGKLKDK